MKFNFKKQEKFQYCSWRLSEKSKISLLVAKIDTINNVRQTQVERSKITLTRFCNANLFPPPEKYYFYRTFAQISRFPSAVKFRM